MINGLDLSIEPTKDQKFTFHLVGWFTRMAPACISWKMAFHLFLVPRETEISRLPKGLWRLFKSTKAGIFPPPNPFLPGRRPKFDRI
jgi:hypothetical protein